MSSNSWGRVDYEPTWQAMQEFTATRDAETPTNCGSCEHPPVYTLGQAGKPEHLLRRTASRWSRSTAAARSPITAPARW
jgi:lipoate-protein ligase B